MRSGETSSGKSARRKGDRSPASRRRPVERESLLTRVLDTVPAVLYSADGQTGELLLLEGAVEQLTGYTRQALLRDSGLAGRIVHPEDRDHVLRGYERGLALGRPFELEFRILHARDHREIWVQSRITPVIGPDGKLLRHDGVSVDITDRRQMESLLETRVEERTAELKSANQALTESEQRYRTLAESAQDAIFIIDRGDRVSYVNPAGGRMFDCRPEDLIGRRRSELFPPEVSERQEQNLRRVIETQEPVTVEERTLFKGRELYLQTHLVAMHDDGGFVRAVMGVSRDVTDRIRTEQALRESEERYRTLVENLPVGVFRVIDPEGDTVLHVNPAFARMHLFDSTEEIIAVPPVSLYRDPADRQRLFDTLERTGAVFGWEIDKRRKDGSPLVVSVTAYAHFDANGRMDYVDGIIEDITDRKRAAEALRESETKYRTLVDNLNICVFQSEAKVGGRIIHINPAGLRMLGFESVEEMRGHPNEAFYVDAADRRWMMEEFRRKGSVQNWEVRTRRRDGTPLLVSITAQARRGNDGQIEYLDGIAEDLTERRRVEARVRLLSAAMEQSTEGIAMADPEGYLIFTNEAFAAMHGYEPRELLGRHMSVFHLPSQMPEVEAVLAETRRTGGFRGEIWHAHRDGTTFPTLMTSSALRDARGGIIALIGTAVDITDRKRADEQRERLSRAIENAGEGIGTWDAQWRLTYANTALARIFGGESPQDFLGRDWPAFFDEGEHHKCPGIVDAVRTEGRWQGRLLGRRSGGTVPISVTLARLGSADGDFLVVANIRDRGGEETHLAQIRKLTMERDHSIERERARISRELHDELGQLLTALNMNLAWFAHSASAEPAMAGRLAETQTLVNQALEAVRRLSTSLRPPILDNQGLLDAVRSHAAEFTQWSGVACRVHVFPSDLEVGDPLATVVFRVVQESLTNIARHSNATRCDVSIKLADRLLELKIRDNGVGAVPDDLEGVQSLGIAGMRERVAAAGGTLRVENAPGAGVCVTARLPWPEFHTRDDE